MAKSHQYERKFLERYGPRLEGSKWKFYLLEGLPFALFLGPFTYLFLVFTDKEAQFSWEKLLLFMAAQFVGGIIYGIWVRRSYLKFYQKTKEKLENLPN